MKLHLQHDNVVLYFTFSISGFIIQLKNVHCRRKYLLFLKFHCMVVRVLSPGFSRERDFSSCPFSSAFIFRVCFSYTACLKCLNSLSPPQGYFCKNSHLTVHKECIQSAPPCLAIPPAPPPRSTVSSSGAVSPSPNCHTPNSPTGTVQPPLPPRTSAHSRQSSASNNFTAVCIADFGGPGPTPSKSPLPIATQESVLVSSVLKAVGIQIESDCKKSGGTVRYRELCTAYAPERVAM